jgi:RNA polymerase sigma-70 factor, ECF subfamily
VVQQSSISLSTPDEAKLVARASLGDPDAVASLYDVYASRIYSYIYRRTSDPVTAEDLTGQVFLRMLEALRNGKGWRTSFSGWLYRIAHNLVVDLYRKRGQVRYTPIDDSPNLAASDSDPYRVAASRLDSDVLLRAINQLTEEQAQVVTLRFLEGYSIAEVADIMDKTDGAIKALQYRGVASLRRIMSSYAL